MMTRRILVTAAGMALGLVACKDGDAGPKRGECCYNPPPPMPHDASWQWDSTISADQSPIIQKIYAYAPASDTVEYHRDTQQIRKVDPAGQPLWSYAVPEGHDRASLFVQSYAIAVLTYSSQGKLAKIVGLNVNTGAVLWQHDLPIAEGPTQAQLGYFAGWLTLMVDQGKNKLFQVYDAGTGQQRRSEELPGTPSTPVTPG